ncbi:MAG: transketolase C-terminal domain-containing protein [Candidatus Absconditabacteria bacterium]|nr:transketolase C-terminal domain-containing protein [Candidatus Absconditabacteria bacterium]
MRNAVIDYIYEKAKDDKNIMLLVGDLGYSVIEQFQTDLPEQFINIGIAEQNMIGIAAGMALTGKKVFCFSIVPFLTMRAYEQIRIDVCSQNLDVNLIGVGGGFAYGSLGNTHYGIEDINVMKGLPNMKILAPADKIESNVCMDYLFANKGPFFVRLNRGGEPDVHTNLLTNINIEKGVEIKKGTDICLFSTGIILGTVLKTAEILEKKGLSTQIISLPLIKPLSQDVVLNYLRDKKGVFTIEEHNVIGGLGDSIASIIAENNIDIKFKKIGIPDIFPSTVGNQDYMRTLVLLDEENLSKNILDMLL